MVGIDGAVPDTLKEAFYELSMKGPIISKRDLEEFVDLYPQFSKELTELATTMAMDAIIGNELEHHVLSNKSIGDAVDSASLSIKLAMEAFATRKAELENDSTLSASTTSNKQAQTERQMDPVEYNSWA